MSLLHVSIYIYRTEQNFIEAAAAGASQSIGLVANIAANLIAFLSLLAFINAVLSWIGSMVDCPQLSFEVHRLIVYSKYNIITLIN